MELNGAKILFTIHTGIPGLGDFNISQTLVMTWIVMALLSGLAFWLGHNLTLENVSKRQAAAEFVVERLDQFVHDNMGRHFDHYIPLVGAIFALSVGCNLISVLGFWSPTADPAVPDRHPGHHRPVFRLVRRLHPGIHLLYPDHHFHQTGRWRGLTPARLPPPTHIILGGQEL